LKGKRFGKLRVLGFAFVKLSNKGGCLGAYWRVRCACGTRKIVRGNSLTMRRGIQTCGGKNRSCGSYVKGCRSSKLVGRRFGYLKVQSFAGFKNYLRGRDAIWNCRCDCGNVVKIRTGSLQEGSRFHCGCRTSEHMIVGLNKHHHPGLNKNEIRALVRLKLYKKKTKVQLEMK
jgi:hypothetical protein